MAFDITKALGDLQPVTNARRLEKIELHLIDKNPRNYYSIDGIDSLADNIATVGLLEPLIVKRTGSGRYMLLSGHRRRAALTRLADEGRLTDGWHHRVQCLVEPGEGLLLPGCPDEGADAEKARQLAEELKLLFANSDTREMSSADKAMQVRRLREVLTALRDLGADLPGKLRDHVAAAAKVSPTRVARLDVIDKGLTDPRLRKAWTGGKLGETSAYEIARRGDAAQKALSDSEVEYLCRATGEAVAAIMDGASEDVREVQAAQLPETEFSADSYLAQRAKEDEEYGEALDKLSEMFFETLADVNSRQDGIETLKREYHTRGGCRDGVFWDGSGKGLKLQLTHPDGWGPHILRTWTEVYDILCLDALYRIAQSVSAADTDEEDEEEDEEGEEPEASNDLRISSPAWIVGEPEHEGRYLCRVLIGEEEVQHEQRMEWRDGGWTVFGGPAAQYQITVTAWWPLPNEMR